MKKEEGKWDRKRKARDEEEEKRWREGGKEALVFIRKCPMILSRLELLNATSAV